MSTNLSGRRCAFTSLPLPGTKTKQKRPRETRLSFDANKRASFQNKIPRSLLWPLKSLLSDDYGLKPQTVYLKSMFRSQHVAMFSTLMTLFFSNNRADEVILQLMFPGI